jgi:hypothetical protein
MTITLRTLETLIDLVEIKLSCLEVYDRDDARELANLENCLNELKLLAGRKAQDGSSVVGFPARGRGRPRTATA